MLPREQRETASRICSAPGSIRSRHGAFARNAGAHGGWGLPGARVRSSLHGRLWPTEKGALQMLGVEPIGFSRQVLAGDVLSCSRTVEDRPRSLCLLHVLHCL
jgi:hypothetical protein